MDEMKKMEYLDRNGAEEFANEVAQAMVVNLNRKTAKESRQESEAKDKYKSRK